MFGARTSYSGTSVHFFGDIREKRTVRKTASLVSVSQSKPLVSIYGSERVVYRRSASTVKRKICGPAISIDEKFTATKPVCFFSELNDFRYLNLFVLYRKSFLNCRRNEGFHVKYMRTYPFVVISKFYRRKHNNNNDSYEARRYCRYKLFQRAFSSTVTKRDSIITYPPYITRFILTATVVYIQTEKTKPAVGLCIH